VIFGVSPAWFLSLYGEAFTVRQAGESLGRLETLGFQEWQPEVFRRESLVDWTTGRADELKTMGADAGLRARVFVAHFLGEGFAGPESTETLDGLEDLKRLMEALESWDSIDIVGLPLPAFRFGTDENDTDRIRLRDAAAAKLAAYARIVEQSGRRLALEAMPGNVIGGSAHLADLLDRDGLTKVGVNLDTGHFHASGEPLEDVLGRLGSRVLCTHLCDNDGRENLSLAPGRGTIPWGPVLAGLKAPAYEGSYDIEIRCPADRVEDEYRKGREELEYHMLKESA